MTKQNSLRSRKNRFRVGEYKIDGVYRIYIGDSPEIASSLHIGGHFRFKKDYLAYAKSICAALNAAQQSIPAGHITGAKPTWVYQFK